MRRRNKTTTYLFSAFLAAVLLLGAAAGWKTETLWAAEEGLPANTNAVKMNLKDDTYSIQVELEGGSGKAGVVSPAKMTVRDGFAFVELQWSSSNYDYMIVDGQKYLPVNEEGMNSVFEVPILAMDQPYPVIADTTAMGTPHEVEYTLLFYADSIGSKGQLPQEAAKRVVGVALVIIVGGGILNHFVNKRNRC